MKGERTQTTAYTNGKNARADGKRLTVFGVEAVYLYLLGLGFAMLGWLVENGYRIVSRGIIDCRYHLLPFIWWYALIPFVYQVLLGDLDNVAMFGRKLFRRNTVTNKVLSNVICLALICGAVFVSELVYGNLWEALFGVRLWNYSRQPLHVTRYAGLISTVGFGVGAYLIFRFLYKPLLGFICNKVSYAAAKTVCLTLGVVVALDTLITTIHVAVLHHAPMYWLIHLW